MVVKKVSTEDLLAQSLIDLSIEKPVSRISVRDIAANCGMSTTTFYNHFDDKYTLMAWINNRDNDSITDQLGLQNNWLETLYLYTGALCKNRAFYVNALTNTQGRESFHIATRNHFVEHMIEHLKAVHGIDAFDEKTYFLLDFYLNALSHRYVAWLLDDKSTSPELFAQLCFDAMPQNLRQLLP